MVYVVSVSATCRRCLEEDSTKRIKLLQVSEMEKEQSSVQTFGQVPFVLCFLAGSLLSISVEHTSASDDKAKRMPHWLPDTVCCCPCSWPHLTKMAGANSPGENKGHVHDQTRVQGAEGSLGDSRQTGLGMVHQAPLKASPGF